MKIVIGLGNPGEKYKDTRHNVGFDFVNQLSEHPRFSAVSQKLTFSSSKKFQAEIAETQIAGEKVILIKPQTYMNLSGNTVKVIMNYFHASNEDLLIVSDDLYLRLGMARIRLEGSSGGHKGLESIIDSLGTENFTRLRIGISEHYVGEQESEEIYQKIEAKNLFWRNLANESGR